MSGVESLRSVAGSAGTLSSAGSGDVLRGQRLRTAEVALH